MATYVPAKRATAYITYVSLTDQSDTRLMKSSPTIAAGDFKVSIDGGALANLATLPVVTPGASKMVKISLSSGEMTGDSIAVVCSDAAGAEWCDLVFVLQTAARQIDDLAFPNTSGRGLDVSTDGDVEANLTKIDGVVNASATLNLTKLNVVNSGGDAIVASSTGSNGTGIKASGNGSGEGIIATGGATGNGVEAVGGATSGSGLRVTATAGDSHAIEAIGIGAGHGARIKGGATAAGLKAEGGVTAGDGILAQSPTNGHGIEAIGGSTTGDGLYAQAPASGHGIEAQGFGAGEGISAKGGATGSGIEAIGGATSGDGIKATAQTNAHGINAIGIGTGDGVKAQAGATGNGVEAVGGASSGAGIYARAAGTGSGIAAEGGNVSGAGISALAQTIGSGIDVAGNGGGHGIAVAGQGAGSGVYAQAGATGHGIYASGGVTNGHGISAVAGGGAGNEGINEIVEGTTTLNQSLKIHNATIGAKLSGAATATNTFRDLADTKNRVTATVDPVGNRTAVSYDLT